MISPPRWTLASASLAPVGMIGGWTLAQSQQDAFDPLRETISHLATTAARSPGTMTTGLAVTGVCHVVTAWGLGRSATTGGRVLLALGGVATAAVAALPADVASRGHGVAAGVAFVALSTWPAVAPRRGGRGPLSRRTGVVVSTVLLVVLAWFVLELQGVGPAAGDLTGLSERVLTGAQSLWPLVVVLAVRRAAGDRQPRTPHEPRQPRQAEDHR